MAASSVLVSYDYTAQQAMDATPPPLASKSYTVLLDWSNYMFNKAERAAKHIILQRPHTEKVQQLYEYAVQHARGIPAA